MSISPLLSALFGMLKLVNCSYSRLIPSGASFSLMGFQMSSYTLPVRPIFTVTGFSGEYAVSASAALSALSEFSEFSAVAALSAAEESAAEESAELSAAEEELEEVLPLQAVRDTAARTAARENANLFLIDMVFVLL